MIENGQQDSSRYQTDSDVIGQSRAVDPSAGIAAKLNHFNPSRWLFCAAFVVVMWGVIEAKSFLIPIIVAALLSLLMMPVVRVLLRLRVPEWLAVTISSLILVLPLVAVASLIVAESNSLVNDWPHISASAKAYSETLLHQPWLERANLSQYLNLSDIGAKLSSRASEGITLAIASIAVLFSAGSQLVLVLFFAVMMLSSRQHVRVSLERILNSNASGGAAKLLDATTDVLEQFLMARLIMILFVAAADFVILKLFQIPYAVSLSVFLGLMTLIPAVGFVLGLIPPLVVALAQGHSVVSTLGLLGALWAVSAVQDHLLTPKLIGRRLNLNFLITYIALFAGERIWGIWGMFLSVPILGVIRIIMSSNEALRPWGQLIQERDELEKAVATAQDENQAAVDAGKSSPVPRAGEPAPRRDDLRSPPPRMNPQPASGHLADLN